MTWLRKMHEATQRLSYSGTFVYQIHQNDGAPRLPHHPLRGRRHREARGHERRAARDRAHPDRVRCYLPDSRVVKVDRRVDRDFPDCSRSRFPR
jgi:sigma-E factor negative regulatory protein RseB